MHLLTFTFLILLAASGPQPEAASSAEADIGIFANVRARELRFSEVPQVRVSATRAHTERTNLPDEVQPHVTYRDIGVRLTIISTLPNIEEILDEALAPPND